MMLNAYKLILAGVSILVILGVLMAVLNHIHLDHIDVNEIALPSSMMVGVAAYWFLSLGYREHYLRKRPGTRLKRVFPALGH